MYSLCTDVRPSQDHRILRMQTVRINLAYSNVFKWSYEFNIWCALHIARDRHGITNYDHKMMPPCPFDFYLHFLKLPLYTRHWFKFRKSLCGMLSWLPTLYYTWGSICCAHFQLVKIMSHRRLGKRIMYTFNFHHKKSPWKTSGNTSQESSITNIMKKTKFQHLLQFSLHKYLM